MEGKTVKWVENAEISPEIIFDFFASMMADEKTEDLNLDGFSVHIHPEENEMYFYTEVGNFTIFETYDEETEKFYFFLICEDENESENTLYDFLRQKKFFLKNITMLV